MENVFIWMGCLGDFVFQTDPCLILKSRMSHLWLSAIYKLFSNNLLLYLLIHTGKFLAWPITWFWYLHIVSNPFVFCRFVYPFWEKKFEFLFVISCDLSRNVLVIEVSVVIVKVSTKGPNTPTITLYRIKGRGDGISFFLLS